MPEIPLSGNEQSKDVIREAVLTEYRQSMDFFYFRLLELNVNLHIVEQILQFPRELLFGEGPENNIFFGQTVNNALQVSILLITKLTTDQGRDIRTLTRFKNKVLGMVKPEYTKAFQKRLKMMKFDQKTQDLLEKVSRLRDTRIAHFTNTFFQEYNDPTMKQESVVFSEILALRDELNTLFHALSFGIKHGTLPASYETGHSDIKDILNSLVQTSGLLNMPERHPDLWQQEQVRLTKPQLEQLNFYRRRFNLPEI